MVDSLKNEMSKWFPIPQSPRSQPLSSLSKGERHYHISSTIHFNHRPGTQEAASWPFIKPEARAAQGWVGSGRRWVLRRLALRALLESRSRPHLSGHPTPPNPRVPRAPSDRSRSNWRVCPLGVPRVVSWLLGRRAPKGSQSPGAQLPRERPPARAASASPHPRPSLSRPLPQPSLPASGHAAQRPPTPTAGS